MFAAPKSIQATVTILENLHVILEKTPRDDIRSEVLPLLFNAFESTTIQVQVSFVSIGLLSDFTKLLGIIVNWLSVWQILDYHRIMYTMNIMFSSFSDVYWYRFYINGWMGMCVLLVHWMIFPFRPNYISKLWWHGDFICRVQHWLLSQMYMKR